MYGIIRTVQPTAEPVSLTEAKQWLRNPPDADDAVILGLLAAAREACESYCNRAFVTQSWRLTLDAFPDGREGITLPYPRLQSVTSVAYTDTNGDAQTFTAFRAVTGYEPGVVVPTYGEVWPVARWEEGSVVVTYVAGYGDPSAVPDGIKTAVKVALAALYENRGDDIRIDADSLPGPVRAMLAPYWAPALTGEQTS